MSEAAFPAAASAVRCNAGERRSQSSLHSLETSQLWPQAGKRCEPRCIVLSLSSRVSANKLRVSSRWSSSAMSMVVDPKAKSNGMDLSWLGKPHEYDPRRLYSQTGADWQYRVDFDRLRQERLVKLQAEMKAENIGALVLFAGA